MAPRKPTVFRDAKVKTSDMPDAAKSWEGFECLGVAPTLCHSGVSDLFASSPLGQRSPARARFGMSNVLYFDGHVDQRAPHEVNPYLPEVGEQIRKTLWKPALHGCTCSGVGIGCLGTGGGLLAEYRPGIEVFSRTAVTRIDKTLTLPIGGQHAGIEVPNYTGSYQPYTLPVAAARKKELEERISEESGGKVGIAAEIERGAVIVRRSVAASGGERTFLRPRSRSRVSGTVAGPLGGIARTSRWWCQALGAEAYP